VIQENPSLPLETLRARHAALGPIEELAGERTFRGRCNTWDRFLEYGPMCAADLRQSIAGGDAFWHCNAPDLAKLILDGWADSMWERVGEA
jgi:hypothetical protein